MPSKLQQAVERISRTLQFAPKMRPAVLGNGRGVVDVPNKPGKVYCRISGQNIIEVINKRVTPLDGMSVIVGYDPQEPEILQVLSYRTALTGQNLSSSIIPSILPHHTMHEYAGIDTVFSDLRQMLPMRPTPYGMRLKVEEGHTYIGGKWVRVSGTDVDLNPYIPVTGSSYALVYLGTDALMHVTQSAVKDTATLTYGDIPQPIPGTIPLAAVRLWRGMSGIYETFVQNDLTDLRWVGMFIPTLYNSGTWFTSGNGTPDKIARWVSGTILGDSSLTARGKDIVLTNNNANDITVYVPQSGTFAMLEVDSQTFTGEAQFARMGINVAPISTSLLRVTGNIPAQSGSAVSSSAFRQNALTVTTATDSGGYTYGQDLIISSDNVSYNYGRIYGVRLAAQHRGSGTLSLLTAADYQANLIGRGSVTTLTGVQVSAAVTQAGTIGTRQLVNLSPSKSAGTITTDYGLRMGAFTYGTTNWAIASEGGASYHLGNFQIGSSTSRTGRFQLQGDGTNPLAQFYNGAGTLLGSILNTGEARFGDEAGGNYVSLTSTLGIRLIGTTTVYDDFIVQMSNVKAPAANAPTWTSYKGSEVPAFSKSADNVLYFSAQLPHQWKEGGYVSFHIHAAYPDNTSGTSRWIFTYSWANITGTFPTQTTITGTFSSPRTTDYHALHDFGTIASAGKTLSSLMLCSISRIGTATADTYDNVIYGISADFHLEIDSLGSSEEVIKG